MYKKQLIFGRHSRIVDNSSETTPMDRYLYRCLMAMVLCGIVSAKPAALSELSELSLKSDEEPSIQLEETSNQVGETAVISILYFKKYL